MNQLCAPKGVLRREGKRVPSELQGAGTVGCISRRPFMALLIVEKETGGVTVLELSGRVTLGEESNQLRTKIKDLLAQGKKRLVLDLGNVSYIDSAGLGTLVAGYTSAQSQGANIKLANLTKRFNEQLNITKLVTVFEVFDSVADAITSLGA
jgi:anti-sigma B factor antagonist